MSVEVLKRTVAITKSLNVSPVYLNSVSFSVSITNQKIKSIAVELIKKFKVKI